MAPPRNATLLELVWAATEDALSEAELVATVAGLINNGAVRLCGTFAGARIDPSTLRGGTSHSFTAPTLTRRHHES
jgi:hypothetical protein